MIRCSLTRCLALALILSGCTDERSADATISLVGGSTANFEMNSVSFRRSGIQTVGRQQFLAFYDTDNRVVIGRRNLGSDEWSVFRTSFQDVHSAGTDTHNVISFGIDEIGQMHISWGMHNHPLLYAKSLESVLNEAPIRFQKLDYMTGTNESSITYPQFYSFPAGPLAFLYRDGRAGDGDICLNVYSADKGEWERLHCPLISGAGNEVSTSPYPQNLAFGKEGEIFLAWTERSQHSSLMGEVGYQTNHDFYLAVSYDQGRSWSPWTEDIDVAPPVLTLPLTKEALTPILRIPEGSSLINQSSLTVDSAGKPVLAAWWAPKIGEGDHTRQYMLAWPSEGAWSQVAVSNRPPETKKDESHVRELARPVVLADRCGGIYMLLRYDQSEHHYTIAYSTDRNHWKLVQLTHKNEFPQEPVVDHELWEMQNVLHLILGISDERAKSPRTHSIGVLQWDPKVTACARDMRLDEGIAVSPAAEITFKPLI